MFGFLFVLQSFAMSISFAKDPWYQWWIWMGVFLLLYFLGRSYYAVTEEDEAHVKNFWYQTRSIVFILDILIFVGLVIYYFAH